VNCFSSESERKRGEDGEDDRRGLSQREANRRAHERRGAWSGHHGGQHSGEEAARVALLPCPRLVDQRAADGGEREANVELTRQGEREEKDQRRKQSNEDGRLQLEAPARVTAGGAQHE